VTELDDDDVVGLYQFDDLVEAALTRVGARAAAANGLVDDGDRERVREGNAPACFIVRTGSRTDCVDG
jgi:hypothetical protein